jgi:hypothetical protein
MVKRERIKPLTTSVSTTEKNGGIFSDTDSACSRKQAEAKKRDRKQELENKVDSQTTKIKRT